jgi:hypothetical protein
MYRLRQITLDDKISEQVSIGVLSTVYPLEIVQQCLDEQAVEEQAAAEAAKTRRVREFVPISIVWFVLVMTLWTRLSQARVWDKLTHKLQLLHPDDQVKVAGASALSYQRALLGEQVLRWLMERCCRLLCTSETPGAFYQGMRLMAIDGTLFNTRDTPRNEAAFGRSRNQYGKGAYPQIRCVGLVECGSHALIDISLGGYTRSEMHGAHEVLRRVEAGMLVMHDAGLFSGGLWQAIRARGAQALSALAEPVLTMAIKGQALSDGSYLAWLQPSKDAIYPLEEPMLIRVIEYRITDSRLGEPERVYRLATTLLDERQYPALELIVLYHERWEIELVFDEIKTHQRQQMKVLRSKTPEGVRQEVFATVLAHYAVRALMLQAAAQVELDADRLSFTEAVFQITEAIDDGMCLAPEHEEQLQQRLLTRLCCTVLPKRHLRINRREVKQVYNKYKPKKRNLPPPEPFEPHERFEDFVLMEVRFPIPHQEVSHALI